MTITRKPPRLRRMVAKAAANPTPEGFIHGADHPPEAHAPPAAETKPSPPRPSAAASPIAAKDESRTKKLREKDKEKAKTKSKKKKDKKKKEAVLIRFEDAQLAQIDSSAESLGLSRAAWVRMVVSKALAEV